MDVHLQGAIARIHEPWGGVLCLDFANTIEPRGGPPPFSPPPGFVFRDELTSYLGLIAWAVRLDLFPALTGESLLRTAGADPSAAERVLLRGHTLRDAIYRIFAAVARGEPAPEPDLAIIRDEYADAAGHAMLHDTGDRFAWIWPDDGKHLARPLWPVARSAADLLITGDRSRVRVCPGVAGHPVACAWLFYDRTKNKSRRWCSMSDCGGATKTRRQTSRRWLARDGATPGATSPSLA